MRRPSPLTPPTSTRRWIVGLAAALLAPLALAPAHAEPWPYAGAAASAEVSPVRVFRVAGVAAESENPWTAALGGGDALIFPALVETIRRESLRPEVEVLLFKLRDAQLGLAQYEELAAAMRAARKRGKRVVVHMQTGVNAQLVAAAAADEVHIVPEGNVFLTGLRAEVSYYKDLFDTVGLRADIEEVGKYKTAPEPYTRTTMSDAAREQLDAMLDSLYGTLVEGVAKGRSLSPDAVRRLVDVGLFGADDARKAGLVDKLSYWPELLAGLEKSHGGKDATLAYPHIQDAPDVGSLFGVLELLTRAEGEPDSKEPRVALLVAEGPIVMGDDPRDLFNNDAVIASDAIVRALGEIEADPLVKAVVLRVDSPGGSALASDLIWRELVRVGKTRPVIVSMGNVAASGGYYIASAGKRIVADKGTITGSIGVFGGKLVYRELLDKVGVTTVTLSRGKHAGLFSGLTPFSDSERAVFRANMEQTYHTFVNRVREGRNMSYDAVHKVAQGRVWTGEQALAIGLVDQIGGVGDALALAAGEAKLGIDDVEIVRFPRQRSLLDLISGDPKQIGAGVPELLQRQLLIQALPAPLGHELQRTLRVFEALLGHEMAIAMMPYTLTVR